MSHALTLRSVVKTYGRRRALDELDLEVPAGSIFGLIGSNGAGKTTFMGAVAGLLRINGGYIDVLGEGPFSAARHAGRVSLLPQDSALPLHGRVDDLLAYYGRLQGLSTADCRASVDSLLKWVNLDDRRDARVRTLSHGMRRRVSIAQAFLGNPELVLLDEPLNGLDPREARNIRDLLTQRRGSQTVIISSHVLSDLEALCDHAAFVDLGKRIRQGSLAELTHATSRIAYHLQQSAAVPMEKIQRALSDVDWSLDAKTHVLAAEFAAEAVTIPALNSAILPMLLEAKVPIREIRTDGSLEGAYLSATNVPPLP